MENKCFLTYDDMCTAVCDEIVAALAQKPNLMLCIAAGHTSLGVFRGLAQAVQQGRADFSKASFVAMDEWTGMNCYTPGSCGDLLQRELLARIPFGTVRLFDGKAQDLEQECRDVEEFIGEQSACGCIDYLVLGSGMNGHLALNEPGTAFDAPAHVTQLDSVTMQVGQKYFEGEAQLSGGVTLGIGNFAQAGRAVLMVSGAHKQEVLQKLLNSPTGVEFPATAMRGFANAALYYDKAAAGE